MKETSSQMRQHLMGRNLSLDLYNGVVVDLQTTTFPLWTLTGSWVGIHQYRPAAGKMRKNCPRECRYFTYVTKPPSGHRIPTAWGLELLDRSSPWVCLTEGVFKACRLHNRGINALAVLGNDPRWMGEWLRSLGYGIIPVCDGDEAGLKLLKQKNSRAGGVVLNPGQYLDDMDSDEVDSLVHKMQRQFKGLVK